MGSSAGLRFGAPFAMVRPASAHTFGGRSRCKLVTTSEVKRNCMRATRCGEHACRISREPMDKNRIQGNARQPGCDCYVMKVCVTCPGRSCLISEKPVSPNQTPTRQVSKSGVKHKF
ncbi:hypothetical protein DBV39_14980 [Orrella marina]|uniref:Uncharacterized protein n=1 Tax=Orrella marina TaxID=2163011 RepID=A0A2R4XLY4_9BURK|nr:hypothetical protein DBV39_14980 [Orrella marina]